MKKINNKMDNLRWRQEGNELKATIDINRKPFGNFVVMLGMTIGEQGVRMKVVGGFGLKMDEKTYADIESANAALFEYFEYIESVRVRISPRVCEAANQAYNRVICAELLQIMSKEQAK